jgi:NAD(P)-dependent dehydrogenase (short-subunit alcohol dehydrogenase family)
MMHAKRVALVTGANKGLGLEISRQLARRGFTVVLGARDEQKGAAAAAKLRDEGLDAHHAPLDVTNPATIGALPRFFEERFGRLDVLVNNAGVYQDVGSPPSTLDLGVLRSSFETNFFGPFLLTRVLVPLLRKSDAGRVVNMSSTLGSLTEASNPASAFYGTVMLGYQGSKAALNMLTVCFAKELRGTAVKVNSACPGWVRTDMGTQAAPLSVAEGADTPVWLATLPADGPTGGFFNSRRPVAW